MLETAFFFASKIGWTLIRPDSWIVIGVLLGTIALIRGRVGRARWLLGSTALFVLVLTVFPVGAWLIRPVEDAFPPIAAPETVDGIMVLGGFEDFAALEYAGQQGTNAGAERLLEGIALAHRYPQARLVITGGSGDPRRLGYSGAEIGRSHALALGVAPDRIVTETASRNTLENAVNTLQFVDIREEETWLLVTSAHHMARSLGIFCNLGVTLEPYPVDYASGNADRWPAWNLSGHLAELQIAVRMWVGMVVYAYTDRSSDIFPTACRP